MSYTLTEGLLQNLLIELDILREQQSSRQNWCYLFRWRQVKPVGIKSDASGVPLLVEARTGPVPRGGIIGFLQKKLAGAAQTQLEPVQPGQRLELTPRQEPGLHLPNCSRMIFDIQLDRDRQEVLQLRYNSNNLRVDGLGFSNQQVEGPAFVKGAQLVGYCGVARTRLRVCLRLLLEKQRVKEEVLRGASFASYTSLPLPFYSLQSALRGSLLRSRRGQPRVHPFLDETLECPSIMQAKLLLPQNQFTIGMQVQLLRAWGQPGTRYVFELALRLARPWVALARPDEQELCVKKLSQVCKSTARGEVAAGTLWDLQKELGGFGQQKKGEDEEVVMAPLGDVAVRVFQLTGDGRLVYCGFAQALLPLTPGTQRLRLDVLPPRYGRAQHERVLFGYSSFGAVPPREERPMFGLVQGNQRYGLELEIRSFHFLPSNDVQLVREKTRSLSSVMSKLTAGGGLGGSVLDKLSGKVEQKEPQPAGSGGPPQVELQAPAPLKKIPLGTKTKMRLQPKGARPPSASESSNLDGEVPVKRPLHAPGEAQPPRRVPKLEANRLKSAVQGKQI